MGKVGINHDAIHGLLPWIQAIRGYHQHTASGLQNIPQKRCLLLVNHSLATYDIALLFAAIFKKLGRIPRPIADHLFFKIPYVSDFVKSLGAIEGKYERALQLLLNEELVCIAPGGMREALRPSSEKYQIIWDKRKGFARLAIESGAPVIIAVCPKADDLYEVYPNKVTRWAYKQFKIPLFFARGIGLSPFPKPVKLQHILSKPIKPPKKIDDPIKFKRQVDRFHKKLIRTTESMINEAVDSPCIAPKA